MVVIPTKDWVDFVAEVRSRLDVIDANIANTARNSDTQHTQQRDDFQELKDQLMGKDDSSITNRVRSLEDTRTKMNGVQLGISFAFSVFSSILAWLLGHPSAHLTMNDLTGRLNAVMASIIGHFGRKG